MDNEGATVDALRVTFIGKVQGVGFRYAAAKLANEYQIRGWVRNAFDGSVEMVAAASVEPLESFLQALQTQMKDNIGQVYRQPTVLNSQMTKFEIRH